MVYAIAMQLLNNVESRLRQNIVFVSLILHICVTVICTKALPLIDRTRFTVLTVNVSHNIISPYSLSKSLTCQMFIFIL